MNAAVSVLSRHGIYPRVFEGKGRRLAEAIAACKASGPELVIVMGGDGTILAAAEAFLETGAALAIVPQGTVNQLARDLAIPLDPLAAIEALAAGRLADIDVGTSMATPSSAPASSARWPSSSAIARRRAAASPPRCCHSCGPA